MATSSTVRSKVWHYFVKETPEVVVCNICNQHVKIKESSTTNMHTHLTRNHNIDSSTLKRKSDCAMVERGKTQRRATNPTTLVSLWTKLSQQSDRHKKITASIAKFIVMDMRPLDSVNDAGFTQMIETLEPRYDLTSRTHITNTVIPEMYQKVKDLVQQEINEANFVSLTTDGWTSRVNKSFITITAHVLNKDWELREFVLSTYEALESHTSENLANDFKESLKTWNIDISKAACTTDNASNIVGALRDIGLLQHVRCAAHTLNLAAQKALRIPKLDRLLGRVRTIVKYLNKSTVAANILRKTQSQLGTPALKPIIDVCTRWNSTFDMIERYLNLRPAIYITLTHKDLRKPAMKDTLTEDDLNELEAVKQVIIAQ